MGINKYTTVFNFRTFSVEKTKMKPTVTNFLSNKDVLNIIHFVNYHHTLE